jgi:hypothetical protein
VAGEVNHRFLILGELSSSFLQNHPAILQAARQANAAQGSSNWTTPAGNSSSSVAHWRQVFLSPQHPAMMILAAIAVHLRVLGRMAYTELNIRSGFNRQSSRVQLLRYAAAVADTAEHLVDVVDSCLHRHGIDPSEIRGQFGQPDGLLMPLALQTQQKRKRRRQGQQQEQQQQQAAPKLSIADQDRLCRITSTTWEEVKAAIISGLCAQAQYILQHAAAHISRAPALISSCWQGGAVGTANTQFIVHMQGQCDKECCRLCLAYNEAV